MPVLRACRMHGASSVVQELFLISFGSRVDDHLPKLCTNICLVHNVTCREVTGAGVSIFHAGLKPIVLALNAIPKNVIRSITQPHIQLELSTISFPSLLTICVC